MNWSWLYFWRKKLPVARFKKKVITYGFRENWKLDRQPMPDDYRDEVIMAAGEWSYETIINFVHVSINPDIIISYRRLQGYKEGWTTSDGDIDIDYRTWDNWRLNSVALHEFGHALGLKHSGRKESVMYKNAVADHLSHWDIKNINKMYGGFL